MSNPSEASIDIGTGEDITVLGSRVNGEMTLFVLKSDYDALKEENEKLLNRTKSLKERVRENSETASWVVEELYKIAGWNDV